MINHINTKQTTTSLVVSYLNYLLEYHKTKALSNKEQEYLSIRNYLKFCDLLEDKTCLSMLNKDSTNKIQNCYKNLQDLLHKQSKSSYSDYFEAILSQLPADSTNKQNEVSNFYTQKQIFITSILFFFLGA